MNKTDCRQLDDYQNSDLDAPGVAAFEEHLLACDECRRTIELDQHINGLLASARPVAPPLLTARIEREVRRERRFQLLRRAALWATAAAVLVAVMWQSSGERHESVATPKTARAPEVATVAPSRPEVRITFPDEANVIARPLESKNPQVSIVWIYPVLRLADQSDSLSSPAK